MVFESDSAPISEIELLSRFNSRVVIFLSCVNAKESD